jgi:CubicO group peptidase (beta-lactamase class C family)
MCAIDEFIDQKIVAGYFPGCVLLVGSSEKVFFHKAFGFAMLEPEMRRMDKMTLLDVASITKPVATAASILLLVEEGLLNIEMPCSSVLEELKGTRHENDTVLEFLTHTSGLPPWYPLYLTTKTEAEMIRFIGNMQKGAPAYSCLDYILLGKVVERISGESLKEYSAQKLFSPMGMTETFFAPTATMRQRCAATECGNVHEKEVSGAFSSGEGFPWRKKMIVGEVHDGNSFYCSRGISGNAGLFSTASDLARFARVLLTGGNGILADSMIRRFFRQHAIVEGERRSIGFLIGGEGAGLLSAETIWHTGFTGCAIWIDPESDIFIVFLTNAVHPVVKPNILRSVRPLIIYVCLDHIRKQSKEV